MALCEQCGNFDDQEIENDYGIFHLGKRPKRRKGYQRKNGHRQWFTELEIKKIKASISPKAKSASKKAEPVIDKSSQEEE